MPAVCEGAIHDKPIESIFPATVVALTVGTFTKTSKLIGLDVTVFPEVS